MNVLKKITYSLILMMMVMVGAHTADAQNNGPSQCEISDIYFDYDQSAPLTATSEITLNLVQGHPDCATDKTRFNLMITEEGDGGIDVDTDIYDEYHNFHNNGLPFQIKFKPHNSKCEDGNSDGCRYFVEVKVLNKLGGNPNTATNTQLRNDIVYSSDYDDGEATTDFFDTQAKLDRARFVIPCTTNCEKRDIEVLSVGNDYSDGQQQCRVKSAKFTPSGDQTNPNFLNPEQQQTLLLQVETEDCYGSQGGEPIRIEVLTKSGSFGNADEVAESATVIGTIPSDGKVEIRYKPGDEDCDELLNGKGYCNYGVRIYNSAIGLSSKEIFESPNGPVDNEPSKIGFFCHESCDAGDEKEWSIVKATLDNARGGNAEQIGIEKDYDVNNPCYYNENGEEGYKLNCYEPLVVLPGTDSGVYQTDEDTNRQYIDFESFQLGDYINFLFKIALGVLMVLAVIMIIIAGVQYMTEESIYGKSNARSRITNAVTGLLLALGIFIILNTINPRLVEDINFAPPTVLIEYNDAPPEERSDGTYATPEGTVTVKGSAIKKGDVWPPANANLIDIRPSLTDMGIKVNRPECPTVGSRSCTSTYFEKAAGDKILERFTKLKEECGNCEFTLTGGSEVWLHSSHRTNEPIVDIRSEGPINQAISGQSTFIGGCQRDKHRSGLGIVLSIAEDVACPWKPAQHWHIKF